MNSRTRALAESDHRHLWHPFTQHDEWALQEPLVIERAEGVHLVDTEGRRYLDGAWYGVPAGFSHALPAGLSESESEAYRNETAARREEGYGDLVGLAWTAARHPQHYARLHAWLLAERAHDRVPGSAHDTLAWVRLAADASAWAANPTLFAVPARLWRVGLAAEE